MTTAGDADVGSLGAETLRLLGALAARVGPDGHAGASADGAARGGVDGVAHDHTSTCTWCPVCQVVDVVRETSPEVLDHLGDSLDSLAAAVRELTQHLTGHRSGRPADDPPVENIDLAEDGPWD